MFGNDSAQKIDETNPNVDPGAEMAPPADDAADEIPRFPFFGVIGVPLYA